MSRVTVAKVSPEVAARSPSYIGVSYCKRDRVWVARIRLTRTSEVSVGRFADPLEAARARDARVRELGIYRRAKLNFPDIEA